LAKIYKTAEKLLFKNRVGKVEFWFASRVDTLTRVAR